MSIQSSHFIETRTDSFSTIIITGSCRSGKTLLGNILATYKEVEYADEPYAPMMLPMVAASGKIEQEFAAKWMRAILRELYNDLLLLRSANFRPGDLSSIWSKKRPEEIFNRLVNITTREQAHNFSLQNQSTLLITLAECAPFIDFIMKAVPKLKLIYSVRDPHHVASDVVSKKWFSDEQLINPLMSQLYSEYIYKNEKWHLPWWVNDQDHEYFISLSEFERGIYYWWSLTDKSLRVHRVECDKALVYYEDLVARPKYVLGYLAEIFNLTATHLTNSKIDEIKINKIDSTDIQIDKIMSDRINLIKEELNAHKQYR